MADGPGTSLDNGKAVRFGKGLKDAPTSVQPRPAPTSPPLPAHIVSPPTPQETQPTISSLPSAPLPTATTTSSSPPPPQTAAPTPGPARTTSPPTITASPQLVAVSPPLRAPSPLPTLGSNIRPNVLPGAASPPVASSSAKAAASAPSSSRPAPIVRASLQRPPLVIGKLSHDSSHQGSHYEASTEEKMHYRPRNSDDDNAAMYSEQGHYVLTDDQVDQWHIYRDLVGLSEPPNLYQRDDLGASYLWCFKTTKEETGNWGVYQRIIQEELRAHVWYRSSTWSTNLLLLGQLVIAAAITSLGASDNSTFKTSITVLGAFNTIIAALLAFFKAKGLPGSALAYRDKLRKQKSEIDYMHRAFCVGSTDVNARLAADRAEDEFNKASNAFESNIATLQRQQSGNLTPKTPSWKPSARAWPDNRQPSMRSSSIPPFRSRST